MTTQLHDWLITPVSQKASVIERGNSIVLNNGLVRRGFVKASNLACVDYTNLTNGQQLLRAIKPEARITIDHKTYNIGGLLGQKENAYLLPEWIADMKRGKEDFVEVKHNVSDIKPFLQWKCKTWAFNTAQATGKELVFEYEAAAPEVMGILVKVHYELYDGFH
jgi:hypothetical protein